MLLAAVHVGPMGIGLIVAVVVACAALGYVASKGDEGMKHRRHQALKAAGKLREKGLNIIPNALQDFAVGDLISLEHRIRDLDDILSDDKRLETEFEKVVLHVNQAKMRDPSARLQYLKSLVAMANAESDVKYVLGRPAPKADTNQQYLSSPTVTAGNGHDVFVQA